MQAKLPGLNDGILILPSTDTTDTGCEWREQICLNRHEYVRASSVQCKMEPPPPCCGVTSKMSARMIEKSVKKRQGTKNYQRDMRRTRLLKTTPPFSLSLARQNAMPSANSPEHFWKRSGAKISKKLTAPSLRAHGSRDCCVVKKEGIRNWDGVRARTYEDMARECIYVNIYTYISLILWYQHRTLGCFPLKRCLPDGAERP